MALWISIGLVIFLIGSPLFISFFINYFGKKKILICGEIIMLGGMILTNIFFYVSFYNGAYVTIAIC